MEQGLNIIQGIGYLFILSVYFLMALGATIGLIVLSIATNKESPGSWWVPLIFLPIPGIPLLFMIVMALTTLGVVVFSFVI